MKRKSHIFHLRTGLASRLLRLFRQPIFLTVTLWGHAIVFGGAGLLYHLEVATNLFVSAILSPEVREVEEEILALERMVREKEDV